MHGVCRIADMKERGQVVNRREVIVRLACGVAAVAAVPADVLESLAQGPWLGPPAGDAILDDVKAMLSAIEADEAYRPASMSFSFTVDFGAPSPVAVGDLVTIDWEARGLRGARTRVVEVVRTGDGLHVVLVPDAQEPAGKHGPAAETDRAQTL